MQPRAWTHALRGRYPENLSRPRWWNSPVVHDQDDIRGLIRSVAQSEVGAIRCVPLREFVIYAGDPHLPVLCLFDFLSFSTSLLSLFTPPFSLSTELTIPDADHDQYPRQIQTPYHPLRLGTVPPSVVGSNRFTREKLPQSHCFPHGLVGYCRLTQGLRLIGIIAWFTECMPPNIPAR